ncbi:glycerol kinase [Limosa lapponica baueri]|uniref:Glycerol kinase n=1 Tax=Limosa lapponica baueri TaxID=1758121 RepID=A0A2I0U2H2_LIMLA|nr:glycerol kinase [Limosa lapponica baueri]
MSKSRMEGSTVQLKCLYTNERSLGNKQEELEATVLLESYDIVAITETWWYESYDWSVAIEGYKLFRRDRQGRRGGGVALYVKEWLESEEMSLKPSLGSDEDRVESLWALVLMGDFNHPDICWEGYTARHVQSRKFLQCLDDNFLTYGVEESTRRGVLLDLILKNKEGLVEDIKVGGSLGCSDHEKIEFRIVDSICKTTSRTETLDFRRDNFDLFKKLLGEIPWVRALEGRGAQESWSIFKYHFLEARDQCIPKSKKSGKGSSRPAGLSMELLKKLKWKKDIYTEWKKGLTAWEDYKNAVRICRDETRKAKASLDLKSVRDVNKKGFFKYIGGKWKTRKNVGLLLNETGATVTEEFYYIKL